MKPFIRESLRWQLEILSKHVDAARSAIERGAAPDLDAILDATLPLLGSRDAAGAPPSADVVGSQTRVLAALHVILVIVRSDLAARGLGDTPLYRVVDVAERVAIGAAWRVRSEFASIRVELAELAEREPLVARLLSEWP